MEAEIKTTWDWKWEWKWWNMKQMCWKCGNKKHLTMHHVIPKALEPNVNLKIPLCKDCHKELHFGGKEVRVVKRENKILHKKVIRYQKLMERYRINMEEFNHMRTELEVLYGR